MRRFVEASLRARAPRRTAPSPPGERKRMPARASRGSTAGHWRCTTSFSGQACGSSCDGRPGQGAERHERRRCPVQIVAAGSIAKRRGWCAPPGSLVINGCPGLAGCNAMGVARHSDGGPSRPAELPVWSGSLSSCSAVRTSSETEHSEKHNNVNRDCEFYRKSLFLSASHCMPNGCASVGLSARFRTTQFLLPNLAFSPRTTARPWFPQGRKCIVNRALFESPSVGASTAGCVRFAWTPGPNPWARPGGSPPIVAQFGQHFWLSRDGQTHPQTGDRQPEQPRARAGRGPGPGEPADNPTGGPQSRPPD